MVKQFTQEVILKSEWLDQSRSRDSMRGRVVLIKEYNEDKSFTQFVISEQWEDSRKENWENPVTPAYGSGIYFNMDAVITDEILFTFYKRSAKLLQWYLPKRNLAKEAFEIVKDFIDLTEVEKDESKRKDIGIKMRYAFSERFSNLL